MKTGMAIVLGVVLATSADSARAQIVFRDTFSGTQLLPHWQQPPPEHWEHTVGGGRLTVTDLFHPGVPGQPNTATIATEFPVYEAFKFELTTLLGWASGDGRILTVNLWGPDGQYAAFGYDESGPDAFIFLEVPIHFPGIVLTAPAPDPGTHEFRLVDEDLHGFRLYVDGAPRLGFGFGSGELLSRVEVVFAGTEGAEFAPLNVGLVSLVPAPGAILVLAGGIGISLARRRR